MTVQLDPATLDAAACYRLMTGVVVPRPIAWVSTLHEDGRVNLAPFSCYTFVSYEPILVGISIGRRAGALKDTAANIQREREFVLQVAHESEAALVHASAEPFPPTVSEVEQLGLRTEPSRLVRTPRLSTAPVALECALEQVMTFGNAGSQFVVGRVVLAHVRDELYRDGKIETDQLRPLARIAGPSYATIGRLFRFRPNGQRG
ncbi:MAG: flavin reductase family protein [Thermocrispum agreste]|uniref:Flavin reductase family protein n=1 Tax=Thermocrispum agreste TaxID=37925 RepID=A0A2W4LS62_9PSEU|nr:MAG: flavin reductase family protein [Thermocrispum agreste]